MNITKMVRQLIVIADDLKERRSLNDYDFDGDKLYDFDQLWGSTALGFGGVGGSAMTTERTYVFIPSDQDKAFVYFGDRFAYECPVCDRLFQDINIGRMASVAESGRYTNEDD